MEKPAFNSIICFGGEDWWYHNHGHIDMQLMRRYAEQATVLYINSIVMQKLNLKQGGDFFRKLVRKTKSILTGLRMSDAGFWVLSPFSLPVQHIAWLRPLNEMLLRLQLLLVSRKLQLHNPVVWVACPSACYLAMRMKKTRLVYQKTDQYEEFPYVDKKVVANYDKQLKAAADLTIFVSSTLYDDESNQCKRAIYLDHGVDFEMFVSAEKDETEPADIASISKPIVGYFGAIDEHKLDMAFIEKLAQLLPDISFVFVGKPSSTFCRLAESENVWLLGQKTYEEIPHYGKCFDVTIIPWRHSRWTEAANPIKVKEYLALGKPFVSTPAFTEIEKYLDVIYVARTPEEFAQSILRGLNENTPERIAARRRKVANDTWDSKAALLLAEVIGKGKDKSVQSLNE